MSPDFVANQAIAIVGMSGRFPGADSIDQFWHNIHAGVESISFFSDDELIAAGVDQALLRHPRFVKAAGIVEGVDRFDAAFFGYGPKEADTIDPQQRVFLECTWEALEDAGIDPLRESRPIGVFAGVGASKYLVKLYTNPEAVAAVGSLQVRIGNDKDFLATRAAYKLGLTGPCLTVQTACSTGLVSVYLAARSLTAGDCDVALAGGVALGLDRATGYMYQEGGIASPDGHCRAFDAEARGTVGGSGAGVVVLKRLADAVADRDCIYAVVRGIAVNNDGHDKVGFTAPSVDGQAAVIARAYAIAGIAADSVQYVEAHGTGTPVGDPIEVAALVRAFGPGVASGTCAIGSVKTNIGHLDAAAGIAGLIKVALALKAGVLPPSLHYRTPNPAIDFARSPFYVNTTARPWPATTARRAAVSSFGMGGTNAHAVLDEAPPVARRAPSHRPWQLLTVSASSASALEASTDRLSTRLQQLSADDMPDVAYTLHLGRRAFAHRRIVVCRTPDAFRTADLVNPVLTGERWSEDCSIAFMFPGQGTQHHGMAAQLYETEPKFAAQLAECAQLLRPHLGVDLRDVLYGDAAGASLDETRLAQPALAAVEYSLARLWLGWGIEPAALIGHSIGEYVAACLAGVMSLPDMLATVAARGRLMQAMPPGAMLAVDLSDERLASRLGPGVSLAAVNAPSMSVVAGPVAIINGLMVTLEGEGHSVRKLHTSHAFHSAMMEPMLAAFAEVLAGITLRAPTVPIVSNVTGQWLTDREAMSPKYWLRQLRETVRFGDGIRRLLDRPNRLLLEVGPGETLSTLARAQLERHRRGSVLSSLGAPGDNRSASVHLLTTLGRLWIAGAPVDWEAFHASEPRAKIRLPTYPFERERHWVERGTEARRRADLSTRLDHSRWLYAPGWLRTAPPLRVTQRSRRHWIVLADSGDLAPRLIERLTDQGDTVTIVHAGDAWAAEPGHFIVSADRPDHFEAVFRSVPLAPEERLSVLHCWALEPRPERGAEAFAAEQRLGFGSLVALVTGARACRQDAALSIEVITRSLHDVTGDDTVYPERAPLLGACTVLRQEHVGAACRVIDIGDGAGPRCVERLADELLSDSTDALVAYRGSHRWVSRCAQIDPPRGDASPRIRRQGVYLITGGLGNVGLALAEQLALQYQARLVLVGRMGLPERSAWPARAASDQSRIGRTIRQLLGWESAGAEVEIVAADVAVPEQMRAAFDRARQRFGDVHGVIHAAGEVGSHATRLLVDLSADDVARQWRAKVHGVYVLDQLLADCDLDFVVLTSSLASILGGVHLGAYAAANAFLDSVAVVQRRSGRPWTSINWDGWTFGDDAARQRPEHGIEPAEGWRAFASILALSAVAQVAVSPTNLAPRLEQWAGSRSLIDPQAPSSAVAAAARHARPDGRQPFVAPRTPLERTIADAWAAVLGLDSVGVHDDFFESGGHSLIGIHLTARLREALGTDSLQVNDLLQSPTVAGLAAAVEKKRVLEQSGALVAIQRSGDRRPFFCVHPIGGHVFRFVALARHLGVERPFYGLQARGLAEVAAQGEHHATIEQMASDYIEAVRQVQPEGPYLLGGWSFGSFVAYEMAQQLRCAGAAVALLAIIDAPSPGNFAKLAQIDDARLVLELARQQGRKAGQDAMVSVADIEGLDEDTQFAYVLDRLKTAGLVPHDIDATWLRHYVRGYRLREQAGRLYVPEPYPGRIVLLRARDIDPEVLDALHSKGVQFSDPTFGWGQLSSEPVEIHTIPGYHETIVLEPNVLILADVIKQACDRADAECCV